MIAAEDVRWTSTRAASRHVPHRWGEMDAHEDVLLLKDTRREYWNNRLEAPNRYVYAFPTKSNSGCDATVRGILKRRVRKDLAPLRVRLFATPGARNEFYGEWIVAKLRTTTDRLHVGELVLLRLAQQCPTLARRFADGAERFRSRNEARHAALLRDHFFPSEDWLVEHEPETLLDLHQPSIVDGVAQSVTEVTRSYTCDFVVAHRRDSRRVCVESKPHERSVDAAALTKGRLLRDRTFARVLVMVGGEEETTRWYDFGPPGTPVEREVWHETFSSLVL